MSLAGGSDETVLVVDDDPGMRETLVEILMTNGILAEGAGSAAAAMARAATLKAAAAVVDQRLPDSTGIELCERLKAADPDIRAILLTGYATLETAIAAVGHLDEFLTKPVAPEQLVHIVRAALDRRRLGRENLVLVQQLTRANHDLEASVTERNRELSGLADMAGRLSTATGLGEVTAAAITSVLEVTRSHAAAIYLGRPRGDGLELVATEGAAPFPERLVGWTSAAEELSPPDTDRLVTDLRLGEDRLGLLVLEDPQMARRPLISAMATQAALAIQNALRLDRERETVLRLEELSRLKSAFLASVSHELRTPLAAVVGFAEVLESRWGDLPAPDVQHILGRMVAQGERLRRLIENLLDSTSLETGTLRVREQRVEVAPTVHRVVETHPAGSEVVTDLAEDLPAVWADESRLEQVLINLLDNAARHGRDGSAPIVISARRLDGQAVELAVADRGPGIDPDFLPRLFDAFTQGSDPDHHPGGVGLGLHITRGIVEAMGGSIGVDSRLGEGTTFWVRLPLADAA